MGVAPRASRRSTTRSILAPTTRGVTTWRDFWKDQFAQHHGIVVATAFYENVERDGKNVVLEFRPNSAEPMLVACL